MSISDKELDKFMDSRYFKDHSDGFIASIISKAAELPQQKVSEFSSILRNIILPEPKLTLSVCLVASFLIGVFSSQSIEAASLNDISSFMYYEGELL